MSFGQDRELDVFVLMDEDGFVVPFEVDLVRKAFLEGGFNPSEVGVLLSALECVSRGNGY
jgi:hypothetical protein